MTQTENTAIVLRYANYRDNDRMLTLFFGDFGVLPRKEKPCRSMSHLLQKMIIIGL